MKYSEKIHYYFRYINWRLFQMPKLKQFKDKHKGKDCFIIGNGPSLNKMELELLNDYHLIGMNKIFLIFNRIKLDINYLVSVNQLVIEQSKKEFSDLNFPVFLSYLGAKKANIKNKNIYNLFTTGGHSWLFSPTVEKRIFEGVTVTFIALQLAYYMGFKNIFLVGVDHNFKQTGDPHEKQTLKGIDPNHFDPNYFAGKEWNLADLKGSELSYHLANYYYHRNGRRIFDATLNGKLEIFPKIHYKEALKIAKKK